MINNLVKRHYPETHVIPFSNVDGTIFFYSRVNSVINSSQTVLDIGCGRGEAIEDPVKYRRDLRILKGKAKHVIGIDFSDVGNENPCIDEFRKITGSQWPIENSSIDFVICDYVLEHLENKEVINHFFGELARVTRPEAYVFMRTPNRYSYPAFAARIIPNSLHKKFIVETKTRKEEDVFPTYYQCNTPRKINKILRQHGFQASSIPYESEPGYLLFSNILYHLGVICHRYAPRIFSSAIFTYAKKVA